MRTWFTRCNLRWLLCLLPVVLVLALIPTGSAAAQGELPRFEPGECNYDGADALSQGGRLECGTLVVPEEYENPEKGEIRLGVAIIRSAAANPAPDPLVMLQGGPGGSTIYTYLSLLPTNETLMSLNRDIVLFDQRGTRYSQPSLFCQEVYDLGIELLDDDISLEESNRQYSQALQQCHDRLVQEGVNLSAYDSLENAADVEALRTTLSLGQINLYGVSYGSLLALHVLERYPEGLRSVILDGVVPPQINFLTQTPQTINRSLEQVFQQCAQDQGCSQAYPDLKEVFYQQVDRLNAEPVHLVLTDYLQNQTHPALLNGDSLIGVVVQMLYQTEMLPLIPRVIYDIRAGRFQVVEAILSLITFDTSLNYGMYYSVLCAEDADYDPAQIDLSGLPDQIVELEKDSGQEFINACAGWQVDALPASVDNPVASDLPALVLSGAFDPVTPPSYAEAAAQSLSNSYSYVFPAGGHGAVSSGECQDSILVQFLNNPEQRPDDACVQQQKMVFSTPGALVRVPVMLDLLGLRGAVGIQMGVYALALLFLLSAVLIYPIVWLVRMLSRPSTPAVNPAAPYGAAVPAAEAMAERPLLYRLGPWMATLAGILLLIFIVVLYFTGMQMLLGNDNRALIGLPGSARPLFFLPLVAALLGLMMLAGALTAWLRKAGSVFGRIYYTLLSLAVLTCVLVLALWDVLFAAFTG